MNFDKELNARGLSCPLPIVKTKKSLADMTSGQVLKVSQANTQRHKDDELTWGDTVWAHWSRSAHVVLTQ